jgi:tetratricopeptide (TPR) repeat protein
MQTPHSKDAELYYMLGQDSLLHDRLVEAVDFFSQAIRENFLLGEAYIARGICYHRQKKFDLALEDMKAAAALGQEDAEHYISLIMKRREKRQPTPGEIWVHKIRQFCCGGGGVFSQIILDLGCELDNIDKYGID